MDGGDNDGVQPLLGSDRTRRGSDRKSVTLSPDTQDQLRLKEDKFSEHRRIRVLDASTPDAMRRISKEYNHQGAGFITPRTRYRKDRGSLCGFDLSQYPAFGTYINMTSSFIGGGIMGLPLAFERAGVIPGAVLALWCALATVLSLFCIAVVCEHGDRAGVTDTFAQLGRVFGRRWGALAVPAIDALAAITLLGVITSCQIIIKDNIGRIAMGLSSSAPPVDTIGGLPPWGAMAVVTVLIVAPLCCLRKLDLLKYSSAMAICSLVYVVILIVVRGVQQGGKVDALSAPRAWEWGAPKSTVMFMKAAPLIVFSFGCQVQLPPLYAELRKKQGKSAAGNFGQLAALEKRRAVSGFLKVIFGAVGSFMCVVICIGIFGCLAFPGSDVKDLMAQGDILKVFDPNSKPAIAARVLLTLALSLMSPLLLWPVRQSIWGLCVHVGVAPHDSSPEYIPKLQHCMLAVAILAVTGSLAASIDNLGIVFGVLGAVGGAIMFYIFPALCFLQLLNRGHGTDEPVVDDNHYTIFAFLAYVLLVYGLIVCIGGTTAIFL